MEFPIFKTKVEGPDRKFDLNNPDERKDYFEHKVGPEIQLLKSYLKNSTFVGYLIGKKNSGKGTYSKLFMEAVGKDHVGHVSIGDIVRDVHQGLESEDSRDTTEGYWTVARAAFAFSTTGAGSGM